VLYSLEYFDSTGNWQEIDNDIFVDASKGMKIITLLSKERQEFTFRTISIDESFLSELNVKPRIVANFYSADKLQIIKTKSVKQFLINCRQLWRCYKMKYDIILMIYFSKHEDVQFRIELINE